jgi:hypothetical protein
MVPFFKEEFVYGNVELSEYLQKQPNDNFININTSLAYLAPVVKVMLLLYDMPSAFSAFNL